MLNAITHRKSELAFSDKPVEKDKISSIFEAVRWAPSGYNAQPWRYISSCKGEAAYNNILSSLAEGNKAWAQNAPILVLSIMHTEYVINGKVISSSYALHDAGIANAYLMLQAEELGLATHPMGGFDKQKIISFFKLPDKYEPVLVIALGYRGDVNSLMPELQQRAKRARIRKEVEDFTDKNKLLV